MGSRFRLFDIVLTMKDFKKLLVFIGLNRVLLILLALFSFSIISQNKITISNGDSPVFSLFQGDHTYTYIQPESKLLSMWSVWDTKYYISIAEDGYSNQRQPYTQVDNKGFFPLYPFLMALLSHTIFFGNVHLAGIIISNLFFILSFIYIKKLIEAEESLKDAVSIPDVWAYILLFPTSVFLSAIYPESLFLFLSILVFYFVKIEKIFWACLCFGLACITKIFGILLIIPIFFYILANLDKVTFLKFLGYVGAFAIIPFVYCMHLYGVSGDPFAYKHIQEAFFSHSWREPFQVIFTHMKLGLNHMVWNGLFLLFSLVVILSQIKRIPFTYTIYGVASILFNPFTGVLNGTSRYVMSLFVLPICIALLVKKQEYKVYMYALLATVQGFAIFWWVIGIGFMA